MKKFLRVFRTEAEYLEYTASTEFNLNSVSRCREGSLVFYNPADCGGQGIHRTISGETYCDGYDKRVYLYKQVSYDDGETWETTATTSSLVEKDSEDCGYVPPTPPSDWDITAKFNVASTSNPTRIASATTNFSKIEIDGIEQQSVATGYTFSTTGEHTVKYLLKGTSIGDSAFSGCTSLTSCTIGSGVTTIGNSAFTNCYSLTSIVIPDSVTDINDVAFYNCTGLTSVNIPSGVTSINFNAFGMCTSLTSINIPDSVTTIGVQAFYNCTGLTSVNIPSGVTTIGINAFRSCTNLTSIDIPNSVISIGIGAFYQCTRLTSCTIGSGVTSIGNYAFYYCGALTSVNIPSGVTTIGEYAFRSCTNLTSIDIPNSVTTIGGFAFASGTSLSSVTIGSGVTSIGGYAFQYCSGLTSITINATTPPTLGNSTFTSTNNCPIYVPCDSVDTYKAASGWRSYASRIEGRGDRTRTASGESYCNGYDKYVDVYGQVSHDCGNTWETTATTPTLVERNSEDCGFVNSVITYMASDKLYETTDSKSSGLHTNAFNVSIKSHTFSNGVGTITFNGVLTNVGGDAFNGCAITSVDIPDTVTIIGSTAFEYTKLTSIVIPSGVTSIGDYAFGYGVSTLKTITCNAMTAPAIGSYTFTGVGSYGTLYVPIGSTGYDVWLSARGLTTWTKVEQ